MTDVLNSSSETVGVSAQEVQALREEFVKNAVGFLSHDQVRGSPVATKRKFLEGKGLSAAEIEEAFRRVPEPVTVSTPMATAVSSPQAPGLVTYVPQPPNPALQQQLSVSAPQLPSQQLITSQPQQSLVSQVKPEPVRWTQVVLGLGVVAAGMYALQSIAMPYLNNMYQAWTANMRARQEEQERYKREALEAAETLRKVHEQLKVASESMVQAALSIKEQASSNTDMQRLLTDVMAELKAAAKSAADAEARRSSSPIARNGSSLYQQHPPHSQASPYGNGYDDGGFYHYSNGGDSSSVLKPSGGWLAGGGPAVQSGAVIKTGPGLQSASDASWGRRNPGYEPEVTKTVNGSNGHVDPYSLQSHQPPLAHPGGMTRSSSAAGTVSPVVHQELYKEPYKQQTSASGEPVYPQSFHDVMDMVAKGITPPNVRTDINDKPPDPTRAASEPKSTPIPKPWERGMAAGETSTGALYTSVPSASEPIVQYPYLASAPAATPAAYPTASKQPPKSYSSQSGSPSSIAAGSSPSHAFIPNRSNSIGADVNQLDRIPPATLSVLQPLLEGSSIWKPPAAPEPTIAYSPASKEPVVTQPPIDPEVDPVET
ncbi:hypothetical protein CEUSTIGMA_g1217.t1 [Chlamydomonas eustigma]|uniref:Peroxisomal membrane protein PEX14 n=1 Tax=Chlamydomonas eustigma TaxID=1157962 RepID=A0A250WSP7_9CHLO|nr:hypothetical protein CEUSTIGMA_g1217.t1 [Chlamydomonas eustigma]|eukprot:GAX73766.1 hypothetical protein CEUSTIGMA_g1217.t1 [Chlamydomonas eustigma]